MKILFVAGSVDHAQTTRAIEQTGAYVLHVSTQEEALGTFPALNPDLILIDSSLANGAAFVCIRALRAAAPPEDWTPIIFLAGIGHESEIELAIDAGGDDFLNQPLSTNVLRAKMRSIQRLVQMHASMRALTRQLDSSNRALQRLSACDGLTGVANRRHFDTTLGQEWRRAGRQGEPLALLMCDVDHFKAYNDSLGHPAGDDCLRRIANTLQHQAARSGDLVARYGGEEFALILPATDLPGAERIAEKIHTRLQTEALHHPQSPVGRVTLSIGIACATPAANQVAAELVHQADQALYLAKQSGRNCSHKYPSPERPDEAVVITPANPVDLVNQN